MKIEEYDCMKMKQKAQDRIEVETKDMTPEELVAYYYQIGEAARKRQMELLAQGKTTSV